MLVLILATIVAFIASISASLLADHITHRIAIIGSFFGLILSHNPGIAYGIRIPSPWQEILIISALVLVLLSARKELHSKWIQIAFGLIVGGALGNLLDRALDGFVTDFIQVGSFYIFNVADSCITVGAGLLLILSVGKRKSHQ